MLSSLRGENSMGDCHWSGISISVHLFLGHSRSWGASKCVSRLSGSGGDRLRDRYGGFLHGQGCSGSSRQGGSAIDLAVRSGRGASSVGCRYWGSHRQDSWSSGHSRVVLALVVNFLHFRYLQSHPNDIISNSRAGRTHTSLHSRGG